MMRPCHFIALTGLIHTACSSAPEINVTNEIIAAQIVENEQRCGVSEPILIGCEYESWGTNKIIIFINGKNATVSDITKKELGRKLVLDSKFPSLDYAMGNRKKDLLAKQLEKSGFCAFPEVQAPKTADSKADSKPVNKNLVAFVPASIMSGLMDEGTIFLRKWPSKKASKTKPTDKVSPPSQDRSSNLPEDTIAKCVVESRGEEASPASVTESPNKETGAKPENSEAKH